MDRPGSGAGAAAAVRSTRGDCWPAPPVAVGGGAARSKARGSGPPGTVPVAGGAGLIGSGEVTCGGGGFGPPMSNGFVRSLGRTTRSCGAAGWTTCGSGKGAGC